MYDLLPRYDDIEYLVGVGQSSVVPEGIRPGTAMVGDGARGEGGMMAINRPVTAMSMAMNRPGTSMSNTMPGFAYPTLSLLRPGTGMIVQGMPGIPRPGTAGMQVSGIARPGTPAAEVVTRMNTGPRPMTGMNHRGVGFMEPPQSSSDLTFGSNTALCGGISR